MNIFARHGDLVIRAEAISEDDLELKPATQTILAGRDSAPHVVRGQFSHTTQNEVTYLRADETCTLTHHYTAGASDGRHTSITLPPGDYVISRLREAGGLVVY